MKRLLDQNVNTKVYWNGVYSGEENRQKYTEVTAGFNGNSQRFAKVLQEISDGEKILDIGCGIGLFTSMVKELYPNCEVWGTDISSQAIEENKAKHSGITYKHTYIGNQELPPEYFDVVFSGEVLEHIEEPAVLFQDAFQTLKPGGTFIMTTPRENRIRSEEHIWEFTQEDVDNLFKENGFESPRFVDLPDTEWWYVIFAVGKKKI